MRKYEVRYILRPDIEQDAVQAAVDKFRGVISNGGEIVEHQEMGKRRLAYEINKFREGFYVLVNFQSNPDIVAELERVMKISDDVIRYLIVKEEE
jgi:small subunit ribosomal protein S6